MQEDTIADLKRFIANTVSQEMAGLNERIDQLESKIDAVNKKIDETSAGAGDAVDNLSAHVEQRLTDYDAIITELKEQRA